MNKINFTIAHAIFLCLCGLLTLTTLVIGQENQKLVIKPGIEAGYEFDPEKNLSLYIVNKTSNNESISSNIGGVFDLSFMGFPLGCLIQFKTSENKVLVLKNQKDDGWMDSSIYSSILMSADKTKEADVILKTTIPANSIRSYPIQYTNVIRLVSANLFTAHSKPHQFRVKCSIKVLESGVIKSKEVISAWFLCGKVMD